jgi:hypothetical protein
MRLQDETKEAISKLEQECAKLRKELKETAENIQTEKQAALMEKEVDLWININHTISNIILIHKILRFICI